MELAQPREQIDLKNITSRHVKPCADIDTERCFKIRSGEDKRQDKINHSSAFPKRIALD